MQSRVKVATVSFCFPFVFFRFRTIILTTKPLAHDPLYVCSLPFVLGEFQWGTTTEEYQKSDDRSRSLPRVDETEATLKIDYNEEEADDNDNGIEHSSPKKAHTTESDFEPTQILSTD
jgi:hypothetical protein